MTIKVVSYSSSLRHVLVCRDCKVIRDPQTHKSKGYGFVCYVHKEASLLAQFFRHHWLPV